MSFVWLKRFLVVYGISAYLLCTAVVGAAEEPSPDIALDDVFQLPEPVILHPAHVLTGAPDLIPYAARELPGPITLHTRQLDSDEIRNGIPEQALIDASESLRMNDLYFFSFGYRATGNRDITNPFSVHIYLDPDTPLGTPPTVAPLKTWRRTSNFGFNWQSFSPNYGLLLGDGQAGEHTLRMVVDADDEISEVNESGTGETNNEFEITFTVAEGVPNLKPAATFTLQSPVVFHRAPVTRDQIEAGGIPEDIVIDVAAGESLPMNERVYYSFGYANVGNRATDGGFRVAIRLDDDPEPVYEYTRPDALGAYGETYNYNSYFALGSDEGGNHILHVEIDPDDAVGDETDEDDNALDVPFSVAEGIPNLKPAAAFTLESPVVFHREPVTREQIETEGIPEDIVIDVKGGEALPMNERVYYSFGYANVGNRATDGGFRVAVLLDDETEPVYEYTRAQPLGAFGNTYNFNSVLVLGDNSAGQHTLRLAIDSGDDVDEGDTPNGESDNEHELSFEVQEGYADLEPHASFELAEPLVFHTKPLERDQLEGVNAKTIPESVIIDPARGDTLPLQQRVYYSFGYRNSGSKGTEAGFTVSVYLEGRDEPVYQYTRNDPLPAKSSTYNINSYIEFTSEAVGQNTFRVVIDDKDNVSEPGGGENNNVMEIPFTVESGVANLAPHATHNLPSPILFHSEPVTREQIETTGIPEDIIIDPAAGDSVFMERTVYFSFGYRNRGSMATPGGFRIAVYMDPDENPEPILDFSRSMPLEGRTSSYAWNNSYEFPAGSDGEHVMRLEVDSDDDVPELVAGGESGEHDNVHEVNFSVAPGMPNLRPAPAPGFPSGLFLHTRPLTDNELENGVPEDVVIKSADDADGTSATGDVSVYDPVYFTFAFENAGLGPVDESFAVSATLDNDRELNRFVQSNGLGARRYAYVANSQVVFEPDDVGRHTLELLVDSDETIAETGEGAEQDNALQLEFSIESGSPNLVPQAVGQLPEPLVFHGEELSREQLEGDDTGGGTLKERLLDPAAGAVLPMNEPVYLSGGFANTGTQEVDAAAYRVAVYLDDEETPIYSRRGPALAPRGGAALLANIQHTFGSDEAGPHTFRLVVDAEDEIEEGEADSTEAETDNSYAVTIPVQVGQPDLIPDAALGLPTPIMLHTSELSSEDVFESNSEEIERVLIDPATGDTVGANTPVHFSFGYRNAGNLHAPAGFSAAVYLDEEDEPIMTATDQAGVPLHGLKTVLNSSLTFPESAVGEHTLTLVVDDNDDVDEGNDADNAESNNTWTLHFEVEPGTPNLHPHAVNNFPAPLIFHRRELTAEEVQGTAEIPGSILIEPAGGDRIPLNEPFFLSLGLRNSGTGRAPGGFSVALQLDDRETPLYTTEIGRGIPPRGIRAVANISYMFLPGEAGRHSMSFTVDSTDDIAEDGEATDGEHDNTFSLDFTVAEGAPNLVPHAGEWLPAPLVLHAEETEIKDDKATLDPSRIIDPDAGGVIGVNQPFFLSFGVLNDGSATVREPFNVAVYVDIQDAPIFEYEQTDPMPPGTFLWAGNASHTFAADEAGTRVFRVVVDPDDSVAERTNGETGAEQDNRHTIEVQVEQGSPNLTPKAVRELPAALVIHTEDFTDAQIQGADGESIPDDAVIRTTVDEAVGVNEPFRITAAYANTGTAPVPEGYVVKLFLDNADEPIHTYTADEPLPVLGYRILPNIPCQFDSGMAGDHHLRLVLDATNVIDEGASDSPSERDNELVVPLSVEEGVPNLKPKPLGGNQSAIIFHRLETDQQQLQALAQNGHVSQAHAQFLVADQGQSTKLPAGQPFYLSVALENAGTAPTGDFRIHLYLDNQPLLEEPIEMQSLPPRTDSYVMNQPITLNAAQRGDHLLRLVLDEADTVSESNEADNESRLAITVRTEYTHRLHLRNGWNLLHVPVKTTKNFAGLLTGAGVQLQDEPHPIWKWLPDTEYAEVAPSEIPEPTVGYWVRIQTESEVAIEVTGQLPERLFPALAPGWNLVGFPTQTPVESTIVNPRHSFGWSGTRYFRFDSINHNPEQTFFPENGYWIFHEQNTADQ